MKQFMLIIITLTIFLYDFAAIASQKTDFQINMDIWNEKKSLASKHLEMAESELMNGNELEGCINQKKAGAYGIEATEALMKAFEINGNAESEINILKDGLNKWKELRDFC